jgi:hypothetical protein
MEKKTELAEEKVSNPTTTPNSGFTATNTQLLAKTFTWPELHAGDDQMNAGSTLTLYSNGTARLDCQTLCFKTHSGDVWHHSFSVFDISENFLFNSNDFDSPTMNDGNPPPVYTWSRVFGFDLTKFNAAAIVKATYSA